MALSIRSLGFACVQRCISRIPPSRALGLAQRSSFSPTASTAFTASRSMSTFLNSLTAEMEELKGEGALETINISEWLVDSPFDLKPSTPEDPRVTLKNGNCIVSFNPSEFEHSGGDESAVPIIVTLTHEKSQLSLACIARMNEAEGDAEGEIEIEHIVVEPLGGSPADKPEPYSPAIGELNDEVKTSLFEYLHSKGVDNDFGADVVDIASKLEEQLYAKWVQDVKTFVEKEN